MAPKQPTHLLLHANEAENIEASEQPFTLPFNSKEKANKKTLGLPTNNLLNETQTAYILGLKAQTLRAFRVSGRGPPFIRISRRAIRYKMSDLDDYIESCRRTSTSDIGEANYDKS